MCPPSLGRAVPSGQNSVETVTSRSWPLWPLTLLTLQLHACVRKKWCMALCVEYSILVLHRTIMFTALLTYFPPRILHCKSAAETCVRKPLTWEPTGKFCGEGRHAAGTSRRNGRCWVHGRRGDRAQVLVGLIVGPRWGRLDLPCICRESGRSGVCGVRRRWKF